MPSGLPTSGDPHDSADLTGLLVELTPKTARQLVLAQVARALRPHVAKFYRRMPPAALRPGATR
jgi:hypothetical protein